ncbi:MAG: hypothetical protein Q4G02_00420 [bacterium]|nr:hypothetical protein [bacterium]
MEKTKRKLRRRFSQLSLAQAARVCEKLGSPKLEKAIVLDTYCRSLGEQNLIEKHQISRATLTRERQTFWRRVDAALFVQDILPPDVYDILIKVFLILMTMFMCKLSVAM